MSESKKKWRQYSIEYLNFGFVASPGCESKPMCPICEKVLCNSSMKPSKLKDHLFTKHSDKKDKDLEFFKALKDKFLNLKMLSSLQRIQNLIVGQCLILPSLEIVLETVMKVEVQF